MLEVLFTQDSRVEDLFCGASSGSEPSLFFSNYFFSLGFKPIQDDFQRDFARMTDEADSSVVLAELQVALFRECKSLSFLKNIESYTVDIRFSFMVPRHVDKTFYHCICIGHHDWS